MLTFFGEIAGPTGSLVSTLKPILQMHKVSAYFSGHDHCEEHIDDGSGIQVQRSDSAVSFSFMSPVVCSSSFGWRVSLPCGSPSLCRAFSSLRGSFLSQWPRVPTGFHGNVRDCEGDPIFVSFTVPRRRGGESERRQRQEQGQNPRDSAQIPRHRNPRSCPLPSRRLRQCPGQRLIRLFFLSYSVRTVACECSVLIDGCVR